MPVMDELPELAQNLPGGHRRQSASDALFVSGLYVPRGHGNCILLLVPIGQ